MANFLCCYTYFLDSTHLRKILRIIQMHFICLCELPHIGLMLLRYDCVSYCSYALKIRLRELVRNILMACYVVHFTCLRELPHIGLLHFCIFSRVLRDSISRYVGPSVGHQLAF